MTLRSIGIITTVLLIAILLWRKDGATDEIAPPLHQAQQVQERRAVDLEADEIRGAEPGDARVIAATAAPRVLDGNPSSASEGRATTDGVWLVGSVRGIADAGNLPFPIRMRDLTEGLGEADFSLPGNGELSIDLAPYATIDKKLPDLLWVEAEVDGYRKYSGLAGRQPSIAEVELSGRRPSRTEYRIDIALESKQVSIRGRAHAPNAQQIKVAFRYNESEPDAIGTDELWVDEDGEEWLVEVESVEDLSAIEVCDGQGDFLIELPRRAPGTFVAYAHEYRPLSAEITFEETPDVDLGVIQLERGSAISGTAFFGGRRVPAGTLIMSRRQDELGSVHYDTLRFANNRFEHGYRSTQADANGRFELDGLNEGETYLLRVVPPAIGDVWHHHVEIEGLGTRVVAPERNVQLECRLVPVRIEFRSEGQLVEHAIARRFRADGKSMVDRQVGFSMMEGAGDTAENGLLHVLIHPTDSFLLDVESAGHERKKVVLSPADFIEGVAIVELERVPPSAVEFELLHEEPTTLEGVLLRLSLYGPGHPSASHATARIHGGRIRFADVPVGDYQADFFLEIDPERAPEDQSCLLPARTHIRGDRGKPFEVNLRSGGRIRLKIAGGGTDVEPSVRVFDPESVASAPTYLRPGSPTVEARTLGSERDVVLAPVYEPGVYRVLVRGGTGTSNETTVTVREGETVTAVVNL